MLGFSLLMAYSPAASAAQEAARILAARGEVVATTAGAGADKPQRPLQRGSGVFSGEQVITGPQGRAQLRFSDGMLLTLDSKTRFAINDYLYRKDRAKDRAFLQLEQGSLHLLTGSIPKSRQEGFKLETTLAILGVRGTDFSAHLGKQLQVSVRSGLVSVTNQAGSLLLKAGQSATVVGANIIPRLANAPLMPGSIREFSNQVDLFRNSVKDKQDDLTESASGRISSPDDVKDLDPEILKLFGPGIYPGGGGSSGGGGGGGKGGGG
uniref:FecR protein domain-containing protein n=1 Tax=Magnetococcus massalia (strain MO-1) TaxID=451514 RepID=A0A1S7LL63_MAGMO|nr:Conserved exported protein of unknown function [Candidatus Magnetococcus massalia]